MSALIASAVTTASLVVGATMANAGGTHNSTALLRPPPIPASGAYLGIAPHFDLAAPVHRRIAYVESWLGRKLGIVSYYVSFAAVPPMTDIETISAAGSMPMISMLCGAPDTSVAAGKYDAQLRAVAAAFKAYGKPILFRWFWEMNLPLVNGHPACLGTAGGKGFIAAYRHIWTVFHNAGAANVGFVWCPSASHSAKHKFDTTFYPGNSYVNWIGADLYDRPTVTYGFAKQFIGYYSFWERTSGNKPIIICETGAVGTASQKTWLGELYGSVTAPVPGVKGTPMRHIHALVYFDGTGQLYDYRIHPGTSGGEGFLDLARSKYFGVMRATA